MTFLVILVIGGYAIYTMTPDERLKLARRIQALARQGAGIVADRHDRPEPFRDALRARTPLALVTGAIAFLIVTIYLLMTLGDAGPGDPRTLLAWGANFGPLTTHGEWWRLGTAIFVHGSFLHMIVNVAALAQTGIIVERMLGHAAFAVIFVAAGVLAGLETLSAYPTAVGSGASGAVFGIYGLLIGSLVWTLRQGSPDATTMPVNAGEALGLRGDAEPRASDASQPAEAAAPGAFASLPFESVKALGPLAAIFFLYHAVDGVQTSELSGLVAGFAAGLALARRAREESTPMRLTAAAAAVAIVVIIASGAMLKGIGDVRPEIARVLALEQDTAAKYEKAVHQFKNGGLSAQALVKIINQSIVPELEAARARLKAIDGVPLEHQPLVASAEEYFRLRDESWRLRADALRRSSIGALRAAERTERQSLEALEKLRPVEEK
jgi:Rhomboid family